MTRALKAGFVALAGAALLVAFPLPGWAQRGGARAGGGMSHASVGMSRGFSGVSRAPMARVAPRMAARPLNRNVARSFVRAGVVRNRSVSSTRVGTARWTRDRFGRWHRAIYFGGLYPGYYYYPYDYGYGYGYGSDGVADNTSYDSGQQPDAAYADQPDATPVQYVAAAPAAGPAGAPPLPDVGELILVRKDGRVVLASAFTISGDSLTYVTREGLRRSFPVAELDKETTRHMNDAYGTTLTLPS